MSDIYESRGIVSKPVAAVDRSECRDILRQFEGTTPEYVMYVRFSVRATDTWKFLLKLGLVELDPTAPSFAYVTFAGKVWLARYEFYQDGEHRT